jgi:hypothetical protein
MGHVLDGSGRESSAVIYLWELVDKCLFIPSNPLMAKLLQNPEQRTTASPKVFGDVNTLWKRSDAKFYIPARAD